MTKLCSSCGDEIEQDDQYYVSPKKRLKLHTGCYDELQMVNL